MRWVEVRQQYPDTWVLIEAIEAESADGMRVVQRMSVINTFQSGEEAYREYQNCHKRSPERELYVCHTKHADLIIKERVWMGVRKNG